MKISKRDKQEWRKLLSENVDVPIKNFFLQMKLTQAKILLKKGEISLDEAVDQIYNLCLNHSDIKHLSDDIDGIYKNVDQTDNKPIVELDTNNEIIQLNTPRIEKNEDLTKTEELAEEELVEEELEETVSSNQTQREKTEKYSLYKKQQEKMLEKERIMKIKREEYERLAMERKLLEERRMKQATIEKKQEDISFHRFLQDEDDVLSSSFIPKPLTQEKEDIIEKKKKKSFFKSIFGIDDSEDKID